MMDKIKKKDINKRTNGSLSFLIRLDKKMNTTKDDHILYICIGLGRTDKIQSEKMHQTNKRE